MSKRSEERHRVHGLDLLTAEQELKDKRRQLFELRMQKERGEVKDTRQFAKVKVDVARLLHHISELQRAEEFEAETDFAPEAEAKAAMAGPVGPEGEAEVQPTASVASEGE